ncbi:fungal-specific transcription factor domain-containing protein [Desarmillaria tabescens]|uniref:Fungal-specific transcription factor domain-containing protein n=1 Tax=Armillaria tabescens TaxID=1929756 RepID=A0AA39K0I0_ARMTA|nr:fungal-specific transcription factor domain-containing protein [Desarmillaria tabescens]KAK0451200.1 fungal-specific transcription factor domain-containing protein [Desarmillaria tabescens]
MHVYDSDEGQFFLYCEKLKLMTTVIQKRGPKPAQRLTGVPSDLPGRRYNASYVAELERRADYLECVLKKHNPDIILPEGSLSEMAELDDDFTHLDLGAKMKNLSLECDKALSERCFGPSSALALFMTALSTKKKVTGSLNTMQLQDYSDLYPWERATAHTETIETGYSFPDDDLIMSLVDIYFETIHPILPILHRPTFTKDITNGLHLRDENFGATLLFVLAVASRHSDDQRVLADPSSRLSAGWKFIEPIACLQESGIASPLFDSKCLRKLAVVYTLGTSIPDFSSTAVGLGLRYAVEIGLHRKKPKGHKQTLDDELKKRSFWALVTLDRLFNLCDGRPIMMHEEDIDAELPVECDDEYWDIRLDGEVCFCQPANKPSKISYFNAQIRLSGIMAVVTRNLYSIKKGRDRLGFTRNDEQHIVSDIDSSMNAWTNSIPDHLRWDPECDDTLFLHQSAVLYSTYYVLQIFAHRPFLRTDSSLSAPSLIISTAAARSSSRILQVHLTRIKIITPHLLTTAFMAGAVLAMNIWSSKRAGYSPNTEDLTGYERCLATLIDASDTWNIAGRSLKMFKGMASSETAGVLDGTLIHASHHRETAAPVPASHLGLRTGLYQTPHMNKPSNLVPVSPPPSVWMSADESASTDLAYLNSSLPTHLGTDLPLDLTNENPSSSFQPLSFDISESEIPGGLEAINMWTSAPPGFSFAAWDSYITNMDFENGHL